MPKNDFPNEILHRKQGIIDKAEKYKNILRVVRINSIYSKFGIDRVLDIK